jgi:hypothetical protein
MVLTVSFVLSPVIGFLATVIYKKLASQKLDTSIGVSGPHVYILVFGETRRNYENPLKKALFDYPEAGCFSGPHQI